MTERPEGLGLGELERLVGGGDSEGPVWMPDGTLSFTRYRRSEIVRFDPRDGAVTVRRTGTGEANGLTLDLAGRLVLCEGMNRRVTRLDEQGGTVVLADSWHGGRLNRPNDVVTRSDGSIYFTDPGLKVDRSQRDLDFSGVFHLTPDGELRLATDECEYPNGLAFSPDESLLYVAITRRDEQCLLEDKRGELCTHRKIRVFDVAKDGVLSNNRVFAELISPLEGAPDGVKVDREGRVYCTGGGGIWVFTPAGEHLGVIAVPERPRNMAFGGPDMSTMYITAGESLFRITTGVRGIGAVDLLGDAADVATSPSGS